MVRQRFLAFIGLAGFLAALAAGAGRAGDGPMPGPVPAQVVTVIDGDTIRVKARIWIGQELEIAVRLAGIDAPEMHGDCAAERDMAKKARERLAALAGNEVALHNIRYGKYAGRVVARVTTPDGVDVGEVLIGAALARPYDGGRRTSWCTDSAMR